MLPLRTWIDNINFYLSSCQLPSKFSNLEQHFHPFFLAQFCQVIKFQFTHALSSSKGERDCVDFNFFGLCENSQSILESMLAMNLVFGSCLTNLVGVQLHSLSSTS